MAIAKIPWFRCIMRCMMPTISFWIKPKNRLRICTAVTTAFSLWWKRRCTVRILSDTVDVALSSDDAFGEQDSELVRIEDAGAFPVEVEVGMMFEADDPETGDVVVYRVTDVADGKAVVDGNHPLAGMKIRFKATVESVRDASDEEIAHGHVHGSHGHYHH